MEMFRAFLSAGKSTIARGAARSTVRNSARASRMSIRWASTTPAYDELMKSLRDDLKHNIRMKADPLEKNVIRSILTEVKNMEIDSRDQLQDEFKLYDLLNEMIKDRRHSAEVYMKEGSPDRFKQVGLNEIREADYLVQYLERLPVATEKQVDDRVKQLANTLKNEDLLTNKQSLFKKVPWKTIQSDWNASKSAVTKSVNRVYEELVGKK
ncbi:hypothetical protein FOA43_002464 [Brettanomyces nanus]|uniref:Altered inheritance of mitochondria protein 41 n=1 Tax=Eeniella nana TaxID=13502 RepID=A0A875S014_EENNA|nr:uncharacterized protein FOA43_002464 [Brettanomyces nanus]QPG75121.1 hypothetical protein FOA43_002464 [Brettanomyces nanus]